MKLEYVASGGGFMRFADYSVTEDRMELVPLVNKWYHKLEEKTNHKFSVLFNAHTEAGYGKKFSIFDFDKYSDSGGLQIVTQGLTVTEEMKDEVYRTQGEWSKIGMSFDEIPVRMTNNRAARGDLSSRHFDREYMKECAALTGQNLRRQIEVFQEMGTECRPLFITQGNCLDSYLEWTDIALKQIPEDLHDKIGGVAMGAAALGHGTLEDIERAFFFSQLPIKQTHMHLLAVGSTKRIIPNLIFGLNGVYDQDLLISYDSTSQSSAVHYGSYYAKHSEMKEWKKDYNCLVLNEMYDDFIKTFGDFPYSREEFLTTWVYTDAKGYLKVHDDVRGRILTTTAVGYQNIYNVIKEVDRISENKKELKKALMEKRYFEKDANLIGYLFEVKTIDDFKYWRKNAFTQITSKRVASYKPNTIDIDVLDIRETPIPNKNKKRETEIEDLERFFQ